MKNICLLLLCCILMVAVVLSGCAPQTMAVSQNAAEQIVVESQETLEKTVTRTKTVYRGDTLIAQLAFDVTYRYDGERCWVVSMVITQTETYDGWEYIQKSLSSKGGKVTLLAHLEKSSVLGHTVKASLSCDKKGTVTYK